MKASALLIGLLIGVATVKADDPPPNLVVFLVDDLGWQDISVPLGPESTPFNRRYRTPNVARLAEAGMRFTDAYASAPVCSPTRTSLLTGRSPASTGITWWLRDKDTHTSKRHAHLDPPTWTVNGLQPGEVTLPRLLNEAGFHTLHVGKAHLGARETPGANPLSLGFAVNVGGQAAGSPGSYYGLHDFGAEKRSGRKGWQVPGLAEYHGKDVYLTDALAERAVKELRQAAKQEGPFFLHFAPYGVHTPIMPNPRLVESYSELDPREAAYASMIESVDQALGAVLATLEELDLLDTTLIVFTSDNGGLSAHSRGGKKHIHNAPLRSGKGSAYEGGVRVPLIVSWPNITAPGSTCSEPVITHDLFPTLLGAARVRPPADYGKTVEGRDLKPLLQGEAAPFAGRALYWHSPHLWGAAGPGVWPFSSIRAGRWKLIYNHDSENYELYDLHNDLGETTELSAEHPKRVTELAGELGAYLKGVGAKMSIRRDTGQAVPFPH